MCAGDRKEENKTKKKLILIKQRELWHTNMYINRKVTSVSAM